MYSKIQFGKDLKVKVLEREDVAEIGHWVYSIYLKQPGEIDVDFINLLLTLNTMEDGPEFAFTYEELTKIADDLIAGKNVKL